MSKIYIVASEESGDLLASEIIDEVRRKAPDATILGIGGAHMAAKGIVSPIDLSALAIVGLVEALKVYKTAVELADKAVDDIIAADPDVVALIDSWGYMIRVAERLKKSAPHIRIVKVVGPQVWAMRPGRAKSLSRVADHLVCIHAFEAPFYEPYNLPLTVMGNPALSRGHVGDRAQGREKLGAVDRQPVLLVLPGSRRAEIEQVAPVLVEAARKVKANLPDALVAFHPAASVRAQFEDAFPDVRDWATMTPVDADRFDIMAAADYALACSGTVTSELALQETPFLVGYHTGWITWVLARFFLFKPDHITLLNIAADDTEIVPEFVQTKLKPEPIAETATRMLQDNDARNAQISAQKKALSRMGESQLRSAEIAADVLLQQAYLR